MSQNPFPPNPKPPPTPLDLPYRLPETIFLNTCARFHSQCRRRCTQPLIPACAKSARQIARACCVIRGSRQTTRSRHRCCRWWPNVVRAHCQGCVRLCLASAHIQWRAGRGAWALSRRCRMVQACFYKGLHVLPPNLNEFSECQLGHTLPQHTGYVITRLGASFTWLQHRCRNQGIPRRVL